MPDRARHRGLRPGATWNGCGVDFVLRSESATGVEVCLFAPDGSETARLPLERQGDLWSITIDGLAPGQLYGYRIDGPYDPDRGHRFNPAKLLVDPWARAVSGVLDWNPSVLGYGAAGPYAAERSDLDSAGSVPLSVVIDPEFDWHGDQPPRTPWESTVIYEAHVRGLTQQHRAVPPELRGSYLGLAHEAVIEHLLALGITAVELLPVQHFVSERHLAGTGLTNYWGYNPLAWFAPHAGYATSSLGRQVSEFKTMVRTLHSAGLEVILDVVYNHTGEASEDGATLTLRGLDNAAYYRSHPGDPSRCEDFTGCGNTLDFSQPKVRELVLDSLEYWVQEMHVDGFRFDLAPILGRQPRAFRPDAAALDRLTHDPVFEGVKLIAEPWDLGPRGYCLGRFQAGWAEWNDRYRDTVRRFWRGDPDPAYEITSRLLGSPDLLADRGPMASINYLTAHDGFTLADLVSFSRKDNSANLEDDRDGSNHNHSANWGAEGPTDSAEIASQRARLQRTFLATLALSSGVPMLNHGDELGRTQEGNNNAYCQDNASSWIDWRLSEADRQLLQFTRRVFALRHQLNLGGLGPVAATATWYRPDGNALDRTALADVETRLDSFGLLWPAPTVTGLATPTSSLFALFHRGPHPCRFRLPSASPNDGWSVLLDTGQPAAAGSRLASGHCTVQPRALVLLRSPPSS